MIWFDLISMKIAVNQNPTLITNISHENIQNPYELVK